MLDKARREGAEPDAYTYTGLMAGLARAGRLQEAEALLEEMVRAGVKPNTVTFGVLLGVCPCTRVSPWSFWIPRWMQRICTMVLSLLAGHAARVGGALLPCLPLWVIIDGLQQFLRHEPWPHLMLSTRLPALAPSTSRQA